MKIVRYFHDLSESFVKVKDTVICHNDLSPCNTVFCNNMPVAIIDWDSLSPGSRWEDLTYILWLWINIGSHRRHEINILEQMEQALLHYNADEETKMDFADKLIWRMDKVITDMPEDNYQYQRTKDWVEFSKLWVKENEKEIKKIIG